MPTWTGDLAPFELPPVPALVVVACDVVLAEPPGPDPALDEPADPELAGDDAAPLCVDEEPFAWLPLTVLAPPAGSWPSP
jgi:hypothetical protein